MRKFLTADNGRKPFLTTILIPLFAMLLTLGVRVSPALATGVYDLPSLSAGSSTWVIDRADVISVASEGKLSGELKKLAQQTGNEVRFVVIRRLDYGETIDSFADKLFAQWFPTPEERAKQTLLVVDTLTNGTAMRTGEGAKQLLTDEMADSVTAETVAIPLREGGKYNQALLGASDRLVAILSGQRDPGPPAAQEIDIESTFASAEETNDRSATVWVVVLLLLATLIPMVTYFWYVGFPGR